MRVNFSKSMAAIAFSGAFALSAQAQDSTQSPSLKDSLQRFARDSVAAQIPNAVAFLEAGNNIVVHVAPQPEVAQNFVESWNDKSVGQIQFKPNSSTDVAAFSGARLFTEDLFANNANLIITTDPAATQDINPLSCLALTGNPKTELRVGVTVDVSAEAKAEGAKVGDRQLIIYHFKAAAGSASEIERARCWTVPLRLVQSLLAP